MCVIFPVLNELFLSSFLRINKKKMNIGVNKIIAKTAKFLHDDAESSTIVRRTKIPIITFKEIFNKSRVTQTGQRLTVDNLLPKLMDRYFAELDFGRY